MTGNTFIIAELSANHNGSIETAKRTILAAKEAGADAVKLQTYTADTLTIDCRKDCFVQKGGLWDGYSLYELYRKAYTPWEWHNELFGYAKSLGLCCFSTPFDNSAVDFLEKLDTPIYKIASFEITDTKLIRYAASKGKPMIISTGTATLSDLELAVRTCREVGNDNITLLKCTSAYPATLEMANLRLIPEIRKRFGVKVGVSDHSMTDTIATTAVALGATVIEKHLILDRKMGGADSGFSMEPEEFARMCAEVRNVEKCLGSPDFPTDPDTIPGRSLCRSLFVCEDMKKGDVLTPTNLRSIRPGNGLHPSYLDECIGKTVNRDIEKGTPFSLDYIQ
ncbi:MAG: pseudaminic acid synthase [Bacteroidaceae bacterium]|nr:pseudaminic acid synthase [Bacteroidaceae bacterium]